MKNENRILTLKFSFFDACTLSIKWVVMCDIVCQLAVSEVEFVSAVSAGGNVKFLPAV